jgi:hypothetical protein
MDAGELLNDHSALNFCIHDRRIHHPMNPRMGVEDGRPGRKRCFSSAGTRGTVKKGFRACEAGDRTPNRSLVCDVMVYNTMRGSLRSNHVC